MRILSCYIAGFGRLKDLSFDFDKGLNQIVEDNGWGKTTFCTFIKAMFYGLEYKRTKSLYERTKYYPWDQGLYGGSLVFELEGRRYRIERSFGKKDGDDSFVLFDELTERESDAFSDAIGEELFGVDRDSFEKSVFFGQNLLETQLTPSLNAKMGDISSLKDDMDQFDEAIKRIEDAKKVYTSTGKVNPGKISIIKEEINKCREAGEKIPIISQSLKDRKISLHERKRQLRSIATQKEELTQKISKLSEAQQQIGALKEKASLLERQEQSLQELREFFDSKPPTIEEISDWQAIDQDNVVQNTKIEEISSRLPKQDTIDFLTDSFENRDLDDETLSKWNSSAEEISALRVLSEHEMMSDEDKKELEAMRRYFAKGAPDSQEMASYRQKAEEIAQLDGRIEALSKQRDMVSKQLLEDYVKDSGGGLRTLVVLLSILLFAGAIASLVLLDNFIFAGVFLGLSILAILFSIMSKRTETRERNLHLNTNLARQEEIDTEVNLCYEQKKVIEEECDSFLTGYEDVDKENLIQTMVEIALKLEKYNHLVSAEQAYAKDNTTSLDKLAESQMALYSEMEPYAAIYGYDLFKDNKELELIKLLTKDMSIYRDYIENKEALEKITSKIAANEALLQNNLNSFAWKETLETKDKLSDLAQKIKEYDSLIESIENLSKELEDYKDIESVDGQESLDELQQRQKLLGEEEIDLRQIVAKEEETIAKQETEIEEEEEKLRALGSLLEQEQQMRDKVHIYEDTIVYLNRAREVFLSKYMNPLRAGMKKYLDLLYSEDDVALSSKNFILDMDLSIRVRSGGSTKEGGFLSAGYKDLTSLCARLALVDVLYKDESPVLIMDDPFVNLDEKKISNGVKLLEELAKNRQVIYFTCHESRMV